MRISAVLLIGLVLSHLYIMHIVYNVETIDFQGAAQRLASPFWRVYYVVMLVLALSHGLNGLRGIVSDYTRSPGWRLFWNVAIWTSGLVFGTLGALVMFTFQPGGR
jgi:succinate dehydrogenase / fumarate reductase membrane anchor subunit